MHAVLQCCSRAYHWHATTSRFFLGAYRHRPGGRFGCDYDLRRSMAVEGGVAVALDL